MKIKEKLETTKIKLSKIEEGLIDYPTMHPKIKEFFLRTLKLAEEGIDYLLSFGYKQEIDYNGNEEDLEKYREYHLDLLERGPQDWNKRIK